MATFESLGFCLNYLHGEATIKVALPSKAPYCQYCVFLDSQYRYERYQCRLTDEWILDYKKSRGEQCPFKWEEK